MGENEKQKVEIPALAYLALRELARKRGETVEKYVEKMIAEKALEEVGGGKVIPYYPVPYPVPVPYRPYNPWYYDTITWCSTTDTTTNATVDVSLTAAAKV